MTPSREIAFIDPSVTDFETLLACLRPDVEHVVLSHNEPAMTQMARVLAARENRENLDAIHVIAHGRPGEVSFASGPVSCETIKDETTELPSFATALGTEKALLIWACETGAGERGGAFIDVLAARTGVRVAAASGIVGAELRGGTWSLDRGDGAGRPPLSPEGMMTYGGIMATFTGTSGNDTANATTGTLTGFSGGTAAQLQDTSGDTFNGGNGADAIVAGSGDDTINLGAGQFAAGESIQGGGNTASGTRDQIVLTAGGTTDLSVGTVSGIETLTGNTSSDTVTMTASQWAGFAAINLGSGLLTTDVLNVRASGDISALTLPTVSNVETGNLTGTSGTDTVTLSGTQLNTILIGSGTINLGAGTGDTINLTSTSTDLNTLGATDGSIQGVEAISASGAAAGVTITLGGQSEAFAISGSGQADTLTGGAGADTIVGGGGADTISGGAGNDTITYDGSDVSIAGGTNTDTLVVTGAITINLASADQSSGDTAGTTGFENVNASGAIAVVSLTGDGNANILTGGGGADTIVGGAGADTLNGGAGDDTITYDSSDISIAGGTNTDTLVVTGAITINLASADQSSGDTANTTGFENVTASGSSAAVSLTGDGNANVLTGGSGADTIVGSAGADTLNGGAGNDTITYDGSDVSIAGGTNTDTLLVNGAATINLLSADQTSGDTANVTGFENVNASGSSAAVSLTGDGNANVFTGGSGADTIVGGAGVDTLAGGAGNDLMTYDGADASIAGGGDIDTLLVNGAATINLLSADQSSGDTANTTGFENVNASGSSAAVSLTGSGGANVLTGGAANDTLNGGGGNDTIDGGGGTGDTMVFSGAFANYTIALSGAAYTIADNRSGSPDGADTVTGVENFQFSDGARTASQLNPTAQNKIALENLKQGNPISEWGVDGDGTGNIQGFATNISTNIGQTVDFKIATDSTNYRLDIYRMGYYGGDGARKVATIDKSLTTAQIQPHPIVDMSLGLIDAGNWSVSASWAIPQDAVSGVYFAKLVREDGTPGQSLVPFIVRDDGSTSDIVFQTSDTTWQAYNEWGGASLYFGNVPVDPAKMIGYLPPNCGCGVNAIGRASAISYNRPIVTNTSAWGGTHDFVFGVEHSAIQWLEQNGYDVSYISGVDSARNGSQLLNHQAFLSVGHDEYWSAEQRTNVEAARDAGVNLAFWSGNEVYWKVRWENSIDGNGTPYRTMVCYKETWGTSTDPSTTGTGTWRDPRYADPGQKPENALTGTMFTVDSYRLDTISVPYDYSNLRFWRNTDVANILPGQSFELVKNLLGYEWDSDVENGFRPAGLVNLSLSTVSVDTYLRDYGTTVGPADVTHSLTMYRAESGALVFGAGTVFWSWGLNANHEGAATPTDRNVQQAMINMFADMGIQPTTIDASLILATQSPDSIKPTSTIISPTVGASFVEGQHVTVTGTAQDSGGGIIAGIEVSTDGGSHWFKATGRENWSYNWVVQASGTYTIKSRAVDDSVNMETPSAGKQVTIHLPSTSNLWTLASTPAVETNADRDGVELGVRFQATTAGSVQGIRFYKGFYNIGEHKVSLWKADGTLLATGTSTGESISGWQTVSFSSPIQITGGTTYVASYHSNGYYSSTDGYFNTSYTKGPLNVAQGGGVYAYGSGSTFPGNSINGTNYWVDVVFDPSTANAAPVAANDNGFTTIQNTAVTLSASSLLANDTDPDGDALTITGASGGVNGSVSFNAQNNTITFNPTAGYTGTASFIYSISDSRGGTASATVNLTVSPPSTATSLFSLSDTPAITSVNDPNSVELGMKFVASAGGEIAGMRFYKGAQDNGPHTGSIWSSTGVRLATATFIGESASGWQTVNFAQPLTIAAGTTYVASYHTNGNYVVTSNYFSTSRTNGGLTAPSSSTSGGNGIYTYGTNSLFPSSTYAASNYWVDVLYQQSTQNAVPVAVADPNYSTTADTPLVIQASGLLANDTDADSDPLTITGASGGVNGTASFNSQTNMVTFTPTAGYTGAASFTYSISDGRGGAASAQVSLTVSPQPTTQSVFTASSTPAIISVNDNNPVNLGMKFQADTAGWISGISFYKGVNNTGSHTGYLWSSTGTLLASATFGGESASGWQSVNLTQDVAIQANTTYVVSYSTNGNYSATSNFFNSEITNGNLHALSSALSGGNGVYGYGSSGLFPTNTYNSANYYVDVAFKQLAA
jgi:Ca2+-binding RTX toxin-like protein